MNCTNARRFLYAFADGELSVRDNCELLDHLKLCPDCSRLVTEQQALRGAVRDFVSGVRVPPTLAQKIRNGVQPQAPAPKKTLRPLVWAIPLAAAAAIALFVNLRNDEPVDNVPTVAPVVTGEIPVDPASNAASLVVQMHERCSTHFATHHNSTLPLDRVALGPALSSHLLSQKIRALAPDFSNAGYRIESANFCEIREGRPTGHILYVSNDGRSRVSFFSAERWDCIEGRPDPAPGPMERRCRQYRVTNEAENTSVFAWHDEATTYICCGPMPGTELKHLVEPIRAAMKLHSAEYAAVLAEARGR